MKICFLTRKDPRDQKSWSGIFYYMYTNLKKEHDVEWIGMVKFKYWQNLVLKIEEKILRISGRKKSPENTFFSYCYAQNVAKKIAAGKYDIIFAPASSSLVTSLKTSIPIVYFSDATFELLTDYYPQFTGLTKRQIEKANKIETKTIARADKIIYCSTWARNSALEFYQASPEKVYVFEMGANLLYEPKFQDLDFSDSEICNIVFIGTNWARKGGEKAYKIYLELKKNGFNCTFTIIGCNPDIEKDNNISVIPFLDKNDKEDFDRFFKILAKSHILLLPTKAECFGIVFCEASAFGIPSITTNTGGVSSSVRDGKNGFLMDVNADEKEFADKIHSLFMDKQMFKQMRFSSRNEFEERLSWEVWTRNFNNCIKNLLQ